MNIDMELREARDSAYEAATWAAFSSKEAARWAAFSSEEAARTAACSACSTSTYAAWSATWSISCKEERLKQLEMIREIL